MIAAITLGMFSALLTIFLNYCIGKPGSKEFSPYEIFSSYTVWLSIRRLQNVGLYNQYAAQYQENIERAQTKHEIITMKNDFKKMLYEAADPFFTWERACGICPVCNGFWIALAVSLAFWLNIIAIIQIIVISHTAIRLLNKVI